MSLFVYTEGHMKKQEQETSRRHAEGNELFPQGVRKSLYSATDKAAGIQSQVYGASGRGVSGGLRLLS